MKALHKLLLTVMVLIALHSLPVLAQVQVQDGFTGAAATNSWFSFNGACLTLGSNQAPSNAASSYLIIPACNKFSYYNNQQQVGLDGNGVDTASTGALRLTNGGNNFNQNGGIISTSPFSSAQGVQVTFTTYTYGGNSYGSASNGADGIGFYLIDGAQLSNIQSAVSQINSCTSGGGTACGFTSNTTLPWYFGSFGGSLGYSCSQANGPYNGMNGAYIGLGIDEFGNFLASSDNTATGAPTDGAYGSSGTYRPERIGVRGYGNISYATVNPILQSAFQAAGITPGTTANGPSTKNGLTTTTTTYTYPPVASTLLSLICQKGGTYVYNYTYTTTVVTTILNLISTTQTTNNTLPIPISLPDYALISGAYYNLPYYSSSSAGTSVKIANESATSRAGATPISYQLQITQDGKLSLSYSYNGGTYTPVLTNQDIRSSNGTIPASFLFGFGASTGSGTNVHEITCFQATPANISASSAALNVPQTSQESGGTQVYLAYYHTNNWWGELEAVPLTTDSSGNLAFGSPPNWDASCVLTGGACAATGTSPAAQSTRALYTSSATGSGGGVDISNPGFSTDAVVFAKLTTTQQAALNAGDSLGALRLAYLSGDRSNEFTSTGTGKFRARTSLLGDIIDASPTWVGAPSASYPDTWTDALNSGASAPENASGATKYSAYVSGNATRLNVVYGGSNDGFMHAFETGSYDKNGNYVKANNDGKEIFAYMPGTVVQSIHSTTPSADFSSVNYAHNYFVDGTPGTGDLFYGGAWHTWLAGGLGPGGNAIYALDITNPSAPSASSVVVGEWNTSSLTCTNISNCASYLGQTYGTPAIKRFHNGEWGLVFGNGLNSAAGHAGIFIMLFKTTSATGSVTVDATYFLDTGVGSASGSAPYSGPDGIAFVTPVDLDGDHITDYVYAGDIYGNLWRFDLTSSTPASWAVTKYPNTANGALFSTPVTAYKASSTATTNSYDAQPIFSQVLALGVAPTSSGSTRLVVAFGTGSTVPQSASNNVSYAPGQQAIYGIWDWNQGVANTPGSALVGLTGTAKPTSAIGVANLQAQTVTTLSESGDGGYITGYRTVTGNTTCYVGQNCSTGTGTSYGWFINLPAYTGVSGVGGANQTEQVIYNPAYQLNALVVDTTVPANNSPLTCSANTVSGWSIAVDPGTGSQLASSFFPTPSASSSDYKAGTPISGIALGMTGTPAFIAIGNQNYIVGISANGTPTASKVNPASGSGQRATWIQLH